MSDILRDKRIEKAKTLPQGSRSRSRYLRTHRLTEADLIDVAPVVEPTPEPVREPEVSKITKVKKKVTRKRKESDR